MEFSVFLLAYSLLALHDTVSCQAKEQGYCGANFSFILFLNVPVQNITKLCQILNILIHVKNIVIGCKDGSTVKIPAVLQLIPGFKTLKGAHRGNVYNIVGCDQLGKALSIRAVYMFCEFSTASLFDCIYNFIITIMFAIVQQLQQLFYHWIH